MTKKWTAIANKSFIKDDQIKTKKKTLLLLLLLKTSYKMKGNNNNKLTQRKRKKTASVWKHITSLTDCWNRTQRYVLGQMASRKS